MLQMMNHDHTTSGPPQHRRVSQLGPVPPAEHAKGQLGLVHHGRADIPTNSL